MRKLIAALLAISTSIAIAATNPKPITTTIQPTSITKNSEFRDAVIHFVRAKAEHILLGSSTSKQVPLKGPWNLRHLSTCWHIVVTIYYQGNAVGQGKADNPNLEASLKQATQEALATIDFKIDPQKLTNFRFHITFKYPPNERYSFIETQDRAVELIGNRAIVRQLDTQAITQQINQSQRYLINVMHPKLHGFFKKYNALDDSNSRTLSTIYTASSLYTLIKIYHFNHIKQFKPYFKPIGSFLLSMQVTKGLHAGAFDYAYDTKTNKKTLYFVVGTTSKTILTLLELYKLYHDDQYLNSAKKGGNWLLHMVKPDGQVMSSTSYTNNAWKYNQKQSFLYSGQVLSALSRLYAVTKDARYYEGATKIAQHMAAIVKKKGAFVGDQYRDPNTISTSWLVMALIDYTKINQEPIYRNIIQQAAKEILARQINNSSDVFNDGRYYDTTTTSGNGWINEVMGELYEFCKAENMQHCQQYYKAIILNTRWLLQNTYTPTNTYYLKNPERAVGGFIRSYISQAVRTDAVCHGLNSLVLLMRITDPNIQLLLTLPERPFAETISLLRVGKGICEPF